MADQHFGYKTTSWSVGTPHTHFSPHTPHTSHTSHLTHTHNSHTRKTLSPCRNLAIGVGNKCFVELNARSVSAAQMQAIEECCNEAIRSQIPMTPRWYQPGTPELEKVLYDPLLPGSRVRENDCVGCRLGLEDCQMILKEEKSELWRLRVSRLSSSLVNYVFSLFTVG